MAERLRAMAPLTGVIFAVLSAISIVITPNSPSAHAGGPQVIAFYRAHHSTEHTSVIVATAAFAFFMCFAASLRSYLGDTGAVATAGALALAAAVLLTAGFTLSGGFTYALADAPNRLAPATAQTLNLLDEDVFFTAFVGAGLFGIASGIAILRGARLPKWLGWAAIVIGLVSFTPAIGLGLLALTPWALVTSVLPYRRSSLPLIQTA
jgi:hypothetical protein